MAAAERRLFGPAFSEVVERNYRCYCTGLHFGLKCLVALRCKVAEQQNEKFVEKPIAILVSLKIIVVMIVVSRYTRNVH